MEQQLIIFVLGNRVLALRAELVIDIIELDDLITLPVLPAPFLGYVEYDQRPIPALHLKELLNTPAATTSQASPEYIIIVGEGNDDDLCLVVDRVVACASADEMHRASEVWDKSFPCSISGELARFGTHLVPVVELDNLYQRRAVASVLTTPEYNFSEN